MEIGGADEKNYIISVYYGIFARGQNQRARARSQPPWGPFKKYIFFSGACGGPPKSGAASVLESEDAHQGEQYKHCS